MNNIKPYNEYFVLMPSGNCKGFNDLKTAKAYINIYYESKVKDDLASDDYNDPTETASDEPRENICRQLGVMEGKCELYDTEDFIKNLKEKLILDRENEEIISKLSEKNLEINLYEYGIDNFIVEIEPINIMEYYGDIN